MYVCMYACKYARTYVCMNAFVCAFVDVSNADAAAHIHRSATELTPVKASVLAMEDGEDFMGDMEVLAEVPRRTYLCTSMHISAL